MKPSIALTTAALASAAALLPAGALAAKPPAGGAEALTLLAAPSPVIAGSPVTLTGKLTAAKAANQKIALRSDPFPFDAFGNAGTASTNAAGDFILIQEPTVNTRYQARQGNLESLPVTVLVRPKVGLRLSDSTPQMGQRVTFSGRVCPEHDGRTVAIQRSSAGRFKTVRRATLLDIPGSTCSRYSRKLTVSSDGRYRTVIAAHADHARGVSPSRRANVS